MRKINRLQALKFVGRLEIREKIKSITNIQIVIVLSLSAILPLLSSVKVSAAVPPTPERAFGLLAAASVV